jgi:HK97 family phage prohead protease
MEFGCFGAPFEVKFAEDGTAAPGSFEGYGAVFGNIDSHGDVIEPGAFAKSLLDRARDNRALPPMYKMHGAMSGNRHEPIGVWEHMAEDTNGLHVKGRLIGLDTEQGKWTYAQLREGALKGLSIGYRVPPNGSRKGSGRPGEPLRTIKAALLREVSLVDDPSNALSRVYSMKGAWGDEPLADEIKTIREFEEALRDILGYSHARARAIAEKGFKSAGEGGFDAENAVSSLRKLADMIRDAAGK